MAAAASVRFSLYGRVVAEAITTAAFRFLSRSIVGTLGQARSIITVWPLPLPLQVISLSVAALAAMLFAAAGLFHVGCSTVVRDTSYISITHWAAASVGRLSLSLVGYLVAVPTAAVAQRPLPW